MEDTMEFKLPDLPFAKDSMKEIISEETFDFHHGKHHAAYVNNLNNLIKGTQFEHKDLDIIIKESEGGIFNNAAQNFNHTFFWDCLSPNGGCSPSGNIAAEINKNFGSFQEFKDNFSKAAATLFGSGWTWLVKNSDGELEILQMPNAGTPLTLDKIPLLTIDVWEHAYYIDYRNARPKFIEKFWEIVNWNHVNSQL
jgi:superoxide dismutase, Fe-Mn family